MRLDARSTVVTRIARRAGLSRNGGQAIAALAEEAWENCRLEAGATKKAQANRASPSADASRAFA